MSAAECKELKKENAKLKKELVKMTNDRDKYMQLAGEMDDVWGCYECDRLFPSKARLLKHEETKTHKKLKAAAMKRYEESQKKKNK